jgi:hypothetical protein
MHVMSASVPPFSAKGITSAVRHMRHDRIYVGGGCKHEHMPKVVRSTLVELRYSRVLIYDQEVKFSLEGHARTRADRCKENKLMRGTA